MTEPGRRWWCAALLGAAMVAGCGEDAILPAPDEAPKEAGYDLRILGGTTHAVAPRELLELVVEVERADGGYDGPVTFTADAPPGIVVIFRPATVLISNSTDVLLVADDTVEPKRYQFTIRGTAPDRPDRTLVLDLTVTP